MDEQKVVQKQNQRQNPRPTKKAPDLRTFDMKRCEERNERSCCPDYDAQIREQSIVELDIGEFGWVARKFSHPDSRYVKCSHDGPEKGPKAKNPNQVSVELIVKIHRLVNDAISWRIEPRQWYSRTTWRGTLSSRSPPKLDSTP